MPLVLCVMGTRPEAIKMAPVVLELGRRRHEVGSIVCVTGQHRQMLDQVLAAFAIRPDVDLDLMRPDQGLSALTAALFPALDDLVRRERPDWVLAQGDTTTVLVASLVAFYNHVRFGHVEAGLRTGDLQRPFPEELNRYVADRVADLLFAPTEHCRRALLREGHPNERIHVTGNTVIDALRLILERPHSWSSGPLSDLPKDGRLVLLTAHRRESFGQPLRDLCLAIRDLAHAFPDVCFVFPVHMNPQVRQPVGEVLSEVANVRLLDPLDYSSLIHLMKRSCLVLTDSGGIQEEAPGLGVPTLVLRDTTERPEGVETGVVKLVGTNRERIVAEAGLLLRDHEALTAMAHCRNPYGDGFAAARIVDALVASKT